MNDSTKTDLGEIKIHENVIAAVSKEAALQIPGVIGIGNNLKSLLLEIIGRSNATSIKIEFDNDNEVTINIPLIVQFGYNIPNIASQVQENVKTAVESAVNISVKDINVFVQGAKKARGGNNENK